jgi:hypothetical protein
VTPELSFVLGGPNDPEEEIENNFRFIRKLKAIHPTCEVVLYFYSPTPRREALNDETRESGVRLPMLPRYGPEGPELPTTPEEWTQPMWIDYVCHQDAPWLTPRLRQRVRDFATVLGCRYPTVQDARLPAWGKSLLRTMASWRYKGERYGNPWELQTARKLLKLRVPQAEGL